MAGLYNERPCTNLVPPGGVTASPGLFVEYYITLVHVQNPVRGAGRQPNKTLMTSPTRTSHVMGVT